MAKREYRALIVDDEPAVRMITIRELSRNGFSCDAAHDGLHAKEFLASTRYDVVVTDLRMPEMNGHALAVDLLARPDRPAVVILTGVTEPRLAKDLIARGVDDILFKPIDQSVLASKVRALVERRASQKVPASTGGQPPNADGPNMAHDVVAESPEPPAIDPSELNAKLVHLAKAIPISQAALDVVNMTRLDTVGTRRLTTAIEMDASLAAEMLRLANSAFYNPTGKAATGVEEAVVRVGQKRIGELALAMSAVGTLMAESLSWMDMALVWRRSVAAGLAIELLIAKASQSQIGSGLFLSAIMHPLGRVVLSTLYPDRYQEMLERSRQNVESLQTYEHRTFQRTHTDIMAQVLQTWNIQADIFEPLKYIQDQPAVVSQLSEPLRTKVELIQLAVLIARIAVGRWELWDLVDLPQAETLRRLKIESIADLIEQTRTELQTIGEMSDFPATNLLRAKNDPATEVVRHEVGYCKLSGDPVDFLVELLPSMGVAPHPCRPADLSPQGPALVNCLGAAIPQVSRLLMPQSRHILVTDFRESAELGRFGTPLALPSSFGAIRSACLQLPAVRQYHATLREPTR